MVTAKDLEGNESAYSLEASATTDNTPPQFIEPPTADRTPPYYNDGSEVVLSTKLDQAGYNLSADFSSLDSEYDPVYYPETVTDLGNKYYHISYTIFFGNTRPNSTYSVVVTARDEAGNAATASASLTLDCSAPTAVLIAPLSGSTISGTLFVIEDTGDPDNDVANFSLEYQPSGEVTWTTCENQSPDTWIPGATCAIDWDSSQLGDGIYSFRVSLTDWAGNTSSTDPITSIDLDNTAPPTPSSLSAQAGPVGTIELTWNASSPDTDVDHYQIYRSQFSGGPWNPLPPPSGQVPRGTTTS